MIVVAVICVVGAIIYPNLQSYLKYYRISGDARRIASQVALARMRSAGNFSQARINIDQTTSPQTFELDVCNGGTFANDNGVAKYQLSPGITFGFGSITTRAEPTYQATIAQTAPVTFNSRGIPVVLSGASCSANVCSAACTAMPTGANAIYLAGDGGLYYAVTVNPGGKTSVWRYSGSAWQKAGN